MPEPTPPPTCLACSRPAEDAPLLPVTYRSRALFICADCLPTLIHHRDRLEATLDAPEPGAGNASR